jgi:hypothetical protein
MIQQMKTIKTTELLSFAILMVLVFGVMGWYSSRTAVPVNQPAHATQQFWI